jgi:hypothetical protein
MPQVSASPLPLLLFLLGLAAGILVGLEIGRVVAKLQEDRAPSSSALSSKKFGPPATIVCSGDQFSMTCEEAL